MDILSRIKQLAISRKVVFTSYVIKYINIIIVTIKKEIARPVVIPDWKEVKNIASQID